MEILRFDESTPAAPKKRGLKSAIGISGIAALFAIGSTFAATTTININSSTPIELGQGVQSIAACDTTISLSSSQTYDSGDEMFYVNGFSIRDVADTCAGKYFNVKVYNSEGELAGASLNTLYVTDMATTTAPGINLNVFCKNKGTTFSPNYEGCEKVLSINAVKVTIETSN